MNDFDFNPELMTDDEIDGRINAIMDGIADIAEEQNNVSSIVNPQKVRQVIYTYKILEYLAKDDKGTRVTYRLYEPYRSVGFVSVVGKKMTFKNPELFFKVIELADNVETYVRADGKVQMNLTFHGLTTPIE